MHSSSGKIVTGVFVAGGLLLFAVGLFWIGDRRQLFSESIELQTEFRNVSGLARGASVRVSGADAGEVLAVGIPSEPGLPFRVRFRVTSDFRPILRSDSVASIQTDGLVGNKFLQIDAGTSEGATLSPGGTIPSREPVEVSTLLDRAGETVRTANLAIQDVREGLSGTIDTVMDLNRQTTEVIDEVANEIQRVTSTGNQIALNINGTIEDVRRGQGSVGKLLTDDTLYTDLRAAATEAQDTIRNVKELSGDFREISANFKSIDLGSRIDRVSEQVQLLTQQASETIQSFQGSGSGGLMAEVRQTLTHTNQAMANLADNTEALKRNVLFRGFFNDRGFFDIGAVSLREYQDRRFLADRQRISESLEGADLFDGAAAPGTILTEEGKRRLDRVMAGYLRYSKNDPLVIEAYDSGVDAEAMLRARDRAVTVRDYLVGKFELKKNYVAVMPMSAADAPDPNQGRDGISLVLYAARGR